MNRSIFRFSGLFILLICVATPLCGESQETRFSFQDDISDTDARLTLARLLSYRSDRLIDALTEYRRVLASIPESMPVQVEMADILLRLKDPDGAIGMLTPLQNRYPDDPDVTIILAAAWEQKGDMPVAIALLKSLETNGHLTERVAVNLARLEADMGHAKASQSRFQDALARNPDNRELLLEYAGIMNLWGDFYQIEAIYRNYLKMHPENRKIRMKLAEVLVSAQQVEAAEGEYEKLRRQNPFSNDIRLALARLHVEKKDFDRALDRIEPLLESSDSPEYPSAMSLKADILFRQKKDHEALRCFDMLTRIPGFEAAGWTGLGRSYRRLNETGLSQQALDKALSIDPENIAIQFEMAGETVTDDGFIQKIMESPSLTPMRKVEWARIYTENGHSEISVRLYRHILEMDTECFPAWLGLAENLAFSNRHDDAIQVFNDLMAAFPGNSKIAISRARTLSWNREYDDAIQAYDEIHRLNPDDVTPIRESARVAVWGKQMDEAQKRYGSLQIPPVDQRAADLLKPAAAGNPVVNTIWQRLDQEAEKGSLFTGYEWLIQQIDADPEAFPETIHTVRIELLPAYRIQKWAYLESRAKLAAWNKRFVPALKMYQELLEFEPGNAEALFDDAQVKCALGLCDAEADPYQQLLTIDATHVMAARALERQKIRSHPLIRLNVADWTEEGRGELSRMKRRQIDLAADMPVRGRYHVRAGAVHWTEDPQSDALTRDADGFMVGAAGILSPVLSGEAAWTRKVYDDGRLGNTDFGLARVRLNLRDWVRMDLGWARTDEIYNEFSLNQKTQADRFRVDARARPTRKLEIGATGEWLDYSDDNTGRMVSGFAGYSLTDHPRIFKILLTETWRNTENENQYRYLNGVLTDIVHPYWTPQDIWESVITLEWHHDLSRELFCGAPLHDYDLKLSFGTDSEDNALIRLEGEWNYPVTDHWSLILKGLIQDSREWDATGLWGVLQYQF
ncbi:MAG: tetratricopeptide repeat protein [Desulfatirhabdiaceae bacterium]